MIALLNYSINLLGKSEDDMRQSLPTGGVTRQDSVYISFDDLRKANAKLIELEYEKEINKNLRCIISNDSISILTLNSRIEYLDKTYNNNIKIIKREKNIYKGVSIISIVALIIVLL